MPQQSGSQPSSASESPAWVETELANPHANTEKAGKVKRMFTAIAQSYDLNNRVHSFGRDQAWRKFAVRQAAIKPGDHILDVACGTGDLSQAFAATAAAKVVGVDFTPRMLDFAREKQRGLSGDQSDKLSYYTGDAQSLEFADATFDVVSIAFGIRNVTSPSTAIAEFFRVLKPGGRLVILEFDRPRFAPVRWANDFYSGWLMPRTATLISGDTSGAYKYLPASVSSFMSRAELLATMRECGFADVMATSLTFGVCACYRGVRSG